VNLTVGLNELNVLARYIEAAAGIVLDETKSYLVESRLGPLLHELRCTSYSSLRAKAQADRSGKTLDLIVDRISTNETSFFRDSHPFELLAHKLVPDHFERSGLDKKVPFRIWSAACSTGQEVYSIAMTLKEILGDFDRSPVRIVGSDISEAALAHASRGVYSKLELSRGLSADRLFRHFDKTGEGWKIADELRAQVYFEKKNLIGPLDGSGLFDLVFCRNVAIYFSLENRRLLFDRLANLLSPRGVLIIGSTETLANLSARFEREEFHGKVFYRKK